MGSTAATRWRVQRDCRIVDKKEVAKAKHEREFGTSAARKQESLRKRSLKKSSQPFDSMLPRQRVLHPEFFVYNLPEDNPMSPFFVPAALDVDAARRNMEEIEQRTAPEIEEVVCPKVGLCGICQDSSSSHAFVPCGHLCACSDCAKDLAQCPVCRADGAPMKIYL